MVFLQVNAVTGTLWAKEIMQQQYQKVQGTDAAAATDSTDGKGGHRLEVCPIVPCPTPFRI